MIFFFIFKSQFLQRIENKYKILSTIIDKNLKSQNYAILKKFSTFLEQKRLVIFPFLQEA